MNWAVLAVQQTAFLLMSTSSFCLSPDVRAKMRYPREHSLSFPFAVSLPTLHPPNQSPHKSSGKITPTLANLTATSTPGTTSNAAFPIIVAVMAAAVFALVILASVSPLPG